MKGLKDANRRLVFNWGSNKKIGDCNKPLRVCMYCEQNAGEAEKSFPCFLYE